MEFTDNPLNTDFFDKLICKYEFSFCSNLNSSSYCAKKYPERFEEILQSTKYSEGIGLHSKVMLTLLHGLITLLSLVGNSLVIVTFIMDKHMRSVTNVFILSLAVADLMVTLTCVPFNIGSVFTHHWIFGGFACKLVPFFMTFSVACSSLTLCSIALDRYVAIVHPYKFKFLQNPKPAGIFLVIIWLVSFLCSVPNLVFYTLLPVVPKCKPQNGTWDVEHFNCVWPDNKYKLPLELWLTLVVLFIVPFVFMSTAYGLIGYQLWIRKSIGGRRNSLRNSDMKKGVIKMLIIVMLAFVLCWSPIMTLNSLEKVDTNLPRRSVELKMYFQCLCLASCCINPVIYTFMNSKFRQKFATYLFCRRNRIASAEDTLADTKQQNTRMSSNNTTHVIPRT